MERMILRLFLLAFVIYTGAAINCYICDSETESSCGETFKDNEHKTQPCPAESTHCGKSNRTIDDGAVHTKRTCEVGTDLELKMDGCVKHSVVDFTAVCNKDGCNGEYF